MERLGATELPQAQKGTPSASSWLSLGHKVRGWGRKLDDGTANEHSAPNEPCRVAVANATPRAIASAESSVEVMSSFCQCQIWSRTGLERQARDLPEHVSGRFNCLLRVFLLPVDKILSVECAVQAA